MGRFADPADYQHHAVQKTFSWSWGQKQHNRIALVNFMVGLAGGWNARYLEIGCFRNDLFHAVGSARKTGVDPAQGGTHRMTSDEFFEQNPGEKFDVVFIDGLHEYPQVRRDTVNALKAIPVGGFIGFHDLLPSSWLEHHVPRLQGNWTGDCWKIALELRETKGVAFCIASVDHGVGMLRKTSEDVEMPDMESQLAEAEFDRFVEELDRLPIMDAPEAMAFIASADLKAS